MVPGGILTHGNYTTVADSKLEVMVALHGCAQTNLRGSAKWKHKVVKTFNQPEIGVI